MSKKSLMSHVAGHALLGLIWSRGRAIVPGMMIASAMTLAPPVAYGQTVSVNNTTGNSAGSVGSFLQSSVGDHFLYGQTFTAVHPTLESFSLRAFSELGNNPNTKWRGAIYEFDTSTLRISSNTPVFSSAIVNHPTALQNGNHLFEFNTASQPLVTGRTYAAVFGVDYASFRADTSVLFERVFLNTTLNLASGAKIRTLEQNIFSSATVSDTAHPLTNFDFGFVSRCTACDAWGAFNTSTAIVPLSGEFSRVEAGNPLIRTTVFNTSNTYYNFVYTPANSSDITGTGSFPTSGLGTAVNPVFAGGTLTGSSTGPISQNFTVTNAAGSTINTNGNALTFSGNFTNAASGVPGSLSVTGAGSATFGGSFGTQTNRMGTLTNTGTTIFGGTGTSWFNAIVNSGNFSILQGATVHDDLTNTGIFNNAGAYFAAVNNSTAAGVITNAATGVWTGNVLSNTTGASITNNGTWVGSANNAATLINAGIWNSAVGTNSTITTSGTFTNQSTGVVNALLTVTGGTATNAGALNAGATVQAGATLTSTGYLRGPLNNSGTANMAGTAQGQMNNSGTFNVTGDLASNTSNFLNSGTGRLNVTGGNYTALNVINNNSTAVNGINVAAGRTLSSLIISNIAGASILNAGTITTSNRLDNNGTLTSTGTINGGIFGLRSFAFSTANISGTVNGDIATAGTFNITGNLTHNNGTLTGGGTFSNFGTLNLTGATLTTGQLTNFEGATTNAAGAINGQVDNGGTFNVTGNLTSNNTGFATVGIGVLNVTGGDYTGLGVVNHNSIAANGINVAAGRTLGASIITVGAGSSILNAGTITTTNRLEIGGTLTTTGTISGGTNGLRTLTGGTINASGTINGLIANSGTFNVTGNLASNGTLQTGGGRLTVNTGVTWTGLTGVTVGTSVAEGMLINGTMTLASNGAVTGNSGSSTRIAAGGTLNGRLILNTGATATNAGTISGLVSTSGTLNSTGQLLGGLTVDSGTSATANVSGTVNGAISNSRTLNVTGNLSSNGLVTNAGTGVITVNAGAAWTGTMSFNNNGINSNAFRIFGSVNTSGTVANTAAGARLEIAAGGSLTAAGGITNVSTARITNVGTINSLVTNSGVLFSNISSSQLLAGLNNNAGAIANLAGVANGSLNNSGTLTVVGNLTSNSAFVNNLSAIATVNAGANWSGLTAVNNLANLNVNGGLSTANVLANGNGAQLTVGATGVVQATGGTTNFAGGTITNAGAFDQVVRNSGTLTSTGALRGGLTNNAGGVANLAGTANGAISNAGALTVTGNLASNGALTTSGTGTVTVNTGAAWTGLGAVNHNATAANGFLINGSVSLAAGQNFNLGAGASARIGAGGALTASDPMATNRIIVVAGSSLINDGTVTGGLNTTGSVTNNGTWSGLILVNAGGEITNTGTWTSTSSNILQTIRGTVNNFGVMLGPISVNPNFTGGAGLFVNHAAGVVNSTGVTFNNRVSNGGTLDNRGNWIGATTVGFSGTGTLLNSGTMTGLVTVNAGSILTSTGTLNTGLTNQGTASLAGTLSGAIANSNSLTATANLASNGDLANTGTGTVTVNAGAAWTGLTAITNSSTNAAGITVDGTLSTTGLLSNGAGSFVFVNAGGTLNAGSVTNAEGGRITVAQGGTVNDALTNNGIVINAGAYNADVNNSGALAFITNEAPGIWTGNVLSNASGGVINNNGIWNGTLNSVSTVSNNDNATWNGAFSLGVGSLTTNNGIWNTGSTTVSTVTDGTFINARTLSAGQVSVSGAAGLLINADTGVITIDGANTLAAFDGGRITSNGTVNGAGSSTGVGSSVANNAGATWNGAFSVGAGSFLSNAGRIAGLVTNRGELTTSGTLSAGLINVAAGFANLAGTANGTIDNAGVLSLGGNLTSNDVLFNGGNGTIVVGAGLSWTGLTAITNSSTNAAGITVDGTLSTTGLLSNGAGSFVFVNAGGTLNAANVVNAEGGVINVAQGGTVNDDLTNAGLVNNAGAYNANVANSGTLGDIFNLATGVWTGNVLSNTADGLIDNSGTWIGNVLSNGATILNRNLWTGDVQANGGTVVNLVNGVWLGNVTSGAGGLIWNAGTWTGALTNSGLVQNDPGALWVGNVDNLAGGGLLNNGRITGTLTNAISASVTNTGTIEGFVLNNGQFGSTGTLTGGLTNTGFASVQGTLNGAINTSRSLTVTGNLASDGAASNTGTGSVTVNAGAAWSGLTSYTNTATGTLGTRIFGSLSATGQVTNGTGAALLVSAGGRLQGSNIVNSGGIGNSGTTTGALNNSSNAALVRNELGGVWTGNVVSNTGGAFIVNAGIWNGTASNAANLINNATWTGALTNLAGGIVNNRGTWAGSLSNAGNTINFAGATITGPVTNTGSLETLGTLAAGLTNSGLARVQGVLNGPISNSGELIITRSLSSNGALANTGNGVVTVSSGTWSGLTGLTNSSASTNGLQIFGSLDITGNVSNGAGAFIRVFESGSLGAANISNAATGQILVSQNGRISACNVLDNSGIVVNAGSFSCRGVNNTGATAVIVNQSSWGGNVLTNTGGASITNNSLWSGNATNAATLINNLVWIGVMTNLAGGRFDNSGSWLGGVTNAGLFQNFATGTVLDPVINTGTVNSVGSINGGLTNSGTVNAQGLLAGQIFNQSAGVITVTGNLLANTILTNSGTARLTVAGGNFTGLGAVTNTSTNAMGIGIAATRTLSSTTLSNAAGATVINQGTLTTGLGTTNSGTLATSGALNGALTNAASGVVQAQGAINGVVTNAGQYVVTGALAGAGAGFTNQATGQLINLGSTYAGLGAIANDAGGRIFLGNGTTNATLSGVSMTNAGAIEMMNGRIGDRVNLTGTYTGVTGSRVSLDINMALNSNQSDRIVAGGTSGVTTVSLQNVGPVRTYFSQPIVLISGAGSSGTFVAANDASTQAALSSNGIVDYSLRTLLGGNDWGIAASVNTGRAASIGGDVMAFTNLADMGVRMAAEGLSAGPADGGQWSGRVWGRVASSSQDVAIATSTSDAYAVSGDLEGELTGQSYSVGGSVRVFASAAGNLDVGLSAGQTVGKTVQDQTGLTSRFEMPVYGAHAVYTSNRIRADLRYDVLELTVDPADLITGGELAGDGRRVSVGLGLPVAIPLGTVEPYMRAELLTMDIDTATLAGGLGTLAFDTQETERVQAGLQTRVVIATSNWTITPSLDLGVTWEDGAAWSRFTPAGGASRVLLGTPRDSAYLDADAGVSIVHNATGWELFGQATGRVGADATGLGVALGARVRF